MTLLQVYFQHTLQIGLFFRGSRGKHPITSCCSRSELSAQMTRAALQHLEFHDPCSASREAARYLAVSDDLPVISVVMAISEEQNTVFLQGREGGWETGGGKVLN